MADSENPPWEGTIGTVTIGATRTEGGTRGVSYTIGGDGDLPFTRADSPRPLIALEICDDPAHWPPVVRAFAGDVMANPARFAHDAEHTYGADLVRLHLTSTRTKGYQESGAIGETVAAVLRATSLPLIIEGSNDPALDSGVFRRCAEASEGERILLGTAEAGRYRSVAAAAMGYGHSVIAQSPIDLNLAKQLNILLREIGVPAGKIVIDPYVGALGYGFEYSYSVMERIRFAALKGDTDLAMPVIAGVQDSLTVKEVREAPPALADEMAVTWEVYTGVSAAIAGASILCVRHPASVKRLRHSIDALAGQGDPAGGGT